MRNTAASRRWRARPENRDHWLGEWNAARVREWQKAHPGYWKKRKKKGAVLQNVCCAQGTGDKEDKPESDIEKEEPVDDSKIIIKDDNKVLTVSRDPDKSQAIESEEATDDDEK